MAFQKGQSGNPSGRPRTKTDITRLDGYANLLTGLNTARDKRTAAEFAPDYVNDAMARDLWLANDVAARIVETIPQEMMRAGYDVKIQADDDGDEDNTDVLQTQEDMSAAIEELSVDHFVEEGAKYERAFGGGALFPIINDGTADLTQPLDMEGILNVSHFVLLEPRECLAETWQGDITKPHFGLPELYRIAPITHGEVPTSNVLVHRSRLVIFPGIRISRQQVTLGRLAFGSSVLTRTNEVMRDFGVVWSSVAALTQDMSQAVYRMKGFTALMAANKEGVVTKLLALMDTTRSVLRMMVIDSDDEFERKQTPLTSVPELLDKFSTRLAAAADMPVTLLMGMSPAGLNATGESDRAFFYDRIARLQKTKIRPQLEQIVRLLFHARSIGPDKMPSPTNGVEPDVWSIQFRPLWEPSQKESIETRWLQAQADDKYIADGVITPEEVASSRFGGDEYSFSTTIDMEARKKMADARSLMEVMPTAMPGQTTPEAEAAKKQAADTAAAAAKAQATGVTENVTAKPAEKAKP